MVRFPNGTILYTSDESYIRCLTWDKKDNLLAGSFGNGYIYRITKDGEAFVIFDSNLKEIHHNSACPVSPGEDDWPDCVSSWTALGFSNFHSATLSLPHSYATSDLFIYGYIRRWQPLPVIQ